MSRKAGTGADAEPGSDRPAERHDTRADGPLKAAPDPARVDEEVVVTYTGKGTVSWSADGGWEEIDIDPDTHKGSFRVPPGSTFITIQDDGMPPNSILIEVLDPATHGTRP